MVYLASGGKIRELAIVIYRTNCFIDSIPRKNNKIYFSSVGPEGPKAKAYLSGSDFMFFYLPIGEKLYIKRYDT